MSEGDIRPWWHPLPCRLRGAVFVGRYCCRLRSGPASANRPSRRASVPRGANFRTRPAGNCLTTLAIPLVRCFEEIPMPSGATLPGFSSIRKQNAFSNAECAGVPPGRERGLTPAGNCSTSVSGSQQSLARKDPHAQASPLYRVCHRSGSGNHARRGKHLNRGRLKCAVFR